MPFRTMTATCISAQKILCSVAVLPLTASLLLSMHAQAPAIASQSGSDGKMHTIAMISVIDPDNTIIRIQSVH